MVCDRVMSPMALRLTRNTEHWRVHGKRQPQGSAPCRQVCLLIACDFYTSNCFTVNCHRPADMSGRCVLHVGCSRHNLGIAISGTTASGSMRALLIGCMGLRLCLLIVWSGLHVSSGGYILSLMIYTRSNGNYMPMRHARKC